MNPHKSFSIPEKFVHQLNFNGLEGRYLRIPSRKKRKIMLIYGDHASLERYYGFVEDLAQYGTVTMPDLPGFGGMQSLYSIEQEPTFDELADYLAGVIKFFYKGSKFTLAGFSIGVPIITRMLQKYPEIAAQVELLVSVAGFASHKDFKIPVRNQKVYTRLSKLFNGPVRSKIFRYAILNSFWIKTIYRFTPNAKHKYRVVSKDEYKKLINVDVELWHCNDVRTWLRTNIEMFSLDFTNQKVGVPIHHVSLGEADQYFNNQSVAKSLRKIYKKCTMYKAQSKSHMPPLIASKEFTKELVPPALRRILDRAPAKK